MKKNIDQRKVKIIAEIHPQHMGSIEEIERMILQCKIGGADYVKVQFYNSQNLFGNNEREYLELTKPEFSKIVNYSKQVGIELFPSIFDEERLKWCEELDIKLYKIASRTVEDKKLCNKIIETKKPVIISLGMYDYKNKSVPFQEKNIIYLYCVSKYPTPLIEIDMPNFENSYFKGFSDHTVGISSCIYAVSKGAKYIEKHFSNNKSMNIGTQQAHVCSMDFNDLTDLRKHCDSITLIKNK
jgi:sialic acid synthase SpsE